MKHFTVTLFTEKKPCSFSVSLLLLLPSLLLILSQKLQTLWFPAGLTCPVRSDDAELSSLKKSAPDVGKRAECEPSLVLTSQTRENQTGHVAHTWAQIYEACLRTNGMSEKHTPLFTQRFWKPWPWCENVLSPALRQDAGARWWSETLRGTYRAKSTFVAFINRF